MAGNTNTTDRLARQEPEGYVRVRTQDDFGTFASDEVILADNTVYEILVSSLTISSGGLTFQAGANTTVKGQGRGITTITYTNANKPLFNSATGNQINIEMFQVNHTSSQDVFDLVGSGGAGSLMVIDKVLINANSGAGWGKLESFVGAELSSLVFLNATSEWLIKDCEAGLFQSFFANAVDSGGALIAYETTAIGNLTVFNNKLAPLAGESVIRVSSAIQDAASRVLLTDLATGPDGELFDPSGLNQTDPRVDASDNFGRAESGISGEGSFEGNATNTLIPAVDAWVLVATDTNWVFDSENRTDGQVDGVVEHTGLEPARIRLDGNISMEPDVSNKALSASYGKIGVEAISVTFDNTGNTFSATGLVDDDTISFYNTPGTLPAALREDVVYFVVNTDQLSYTEGGSAIAFADDGTGPNTLDLATLRGSRSVNQVTAGNSEEIVVQALLDVDTGNRIGQFIRNRTDAVDILVLQSFTRI